MPSQVGQERHFSRQRNRGDHQSQIVQAGIGQATRIRLVVEDARHRDRGQAVRGQVDAGGNESKSDEGLE